MSDAVREPVAPPARPLWPRHEEDEIEAVTRVLRSGLSNYWTGTEGRLFEEEFAAYTGAQHALTCSSGTAALELALNALRLPAGSAVLVPARTFVATASAVVNAGLMPVLCDVEAATLNVTAETLNAALLANERQGSPAVSAVVVVHYAGLPCDMARICEWAWERGLRVVEDAAHAHGARIGTRHVGTFGDVGCFSMCVGKIMSTGGEGGMVVTSHPWLADRVRARRDHGRFSMVGSGTDLSTFKYTVTEPGCNYRQTEMQSAIGRCQLRKLDGWIARRRAIAAIYDEYMMDAGCPPAVKDGHSFYMYLSRAPGWKRNKLIDDGGVGARFGGCPSIAKEPAFSSYLSMDAVAVREGERVFSLPVYPTIPDNDAHEIGRKARDFLNNQ